MIILRNCPVRKVPSPDSLGALEVMFSVQDFKDLSLFPTN